jgi:predicted Zn-dependent peptidase
MKRVLAILALVACGAPPGPPPKPPAPPAPATAPLVTPDAPFRARAPAPDGKLAFVAPKIQEAKLKNGLRVLVVERHELPIVSARLVVGIGAGDVPDATPGLLSFLGAMLEQGTKKRDALEISDDFEAIGAQHGAWVDWDSGGLSARFLSERLDAALELYSDVALNPRFPEAEIERVRTRRIGAIQQEKSSPPQIAQNAIAAAVFGRAHPYGHNITGEEADVKKITREALVRLHARMFVPQNAALVFVGDVTTATLVPKLEATFGAWRSSAAALTRRPPKTPPPAKRHLVLVDRAGAQSQVQLVRAGVPFAVKDREAFAVANAILGGMFSSRVNLNLRERNQFTYGARSHFAMRHGAGPFTVGAAVHAEKTGAAIQELMNELESLKRDGPTDDELALAKESLRLALPGRFESSSEVGDAVADLFVYDLPLDDYERRPARIEAVTAADVKRVAKDYFSTDQLTVVVVGGREQVLSQLAPLQLGPPDERDAFGNTIAAGAAHAPSSK